MLVEEIKKEEGWSNRRPQNGSTALIWLYRSITPAGDA